MVQQIQELTARGAAQNGMTLFHPAEALRLASVVLPASR